MVAHCGTHQRSKPSWVAVAPVIIAFCAQRQLLLQTSAALQVHPIERDLSAVCQWAADRGIQWHNGARLVEQHGAWGVVNAQEQQLKAGDLLLQVPNDLVWNAGTIREEWRHQEDSNIDAALRLVKHAGFGIHQAEFLLFADVLLLLSRHNDGEPTHNAWFDALPQHFTTGVSMTNAEKMCLPVWSRALAERETAKFKAFCHALSELNVLDKAAFDVGKLLWVYNVVCSRCWKTDTQDLDRTVLVPIGDMFNHRDPANVLVVPGNEMVNFMYKAVDASDNGLYLSYGGVTNLHRFLIVFGFVDQNVSEIFSELAFPNATAPHVALGCNDPSQLVFRASDGAISNAVWDSILYALLASRPDEQSRLLTDGGEYKRALHDKYARATAAVLRGHVDGKLQELRCLAEKIERTSASPALNEIRRQNQLLTSVFAKVRARLE